MTSQNLELVVLVGLQASGKTTFFHERFASSHVHVSKDLFPNARNRERRQNHEIAEALKHGRSVVVDNTNPTRETRATMVALARAAGARLVGYYFESRLAASLERNSLRAGRSRVPDVALKATASRLEKPALDEGFEELWYVSIVQERFVVQPWDEFNESR